MIPIKMILFGLGAIAIAGTIYAAKSYVDGLNNKITEQQEIIAGQQIDIEQLKISNQSLEDSIRHKVEEATAAREELDRLRQVDAESKQRLVEIERKLRDATEVKRKENIRKSRKASLLLRLVNEDIKCQLENFGRIDGACIRGKWKIDE